MLPASCSTPDLREAGALLRLRDGTPAGVQTGDRGTIYIELAIAPGFASTSTCDTASSAG